MAGPMEFIQAVRAMKDIPSLLRQKAPVYLSVVPKIWPFPPRVLCSLGSCQDHGPRSSSRSPPSDGCGPDAFALGSRHHLPRHGLRRRHPGRCGWTPLAHQTVDHTRDSVRDGRHPAPGTPSASPAPMVGPPALARVAFGIRPTHPPLVRRIQPIRPHDLGARFTARAADSAG